MAFEIPTAKETRQRLFRIGFEQTQPDTAEMLDFGDDEFGFKIENAGRLLVAKFAIDQVRTWGSDAPVEVVVHCPDYYTMHNTLDGDDVFPKDAVVPGFALAAVPAFGVIMQIKGILDV